MSRIYNKGEHTTHGKHALTKRSSCKRKRLPKYVPFRNIYEERDVSKLTFRQQLMVMKYREVLSKAETQMFFVPDNSMNLVYPFRYSRRQSKTDKSKEVNSLETARDAQRPNAIDIHMFVSENVSGVNAEDGYSSNETEESGDDETRGSAKPSVNTTIKCTNGTLCTQSADISGFQRTECSSRLSHLEEAIFKLLRYNK